jgi:hypothetical protein
MPAAIGIRFVMVSRCGGASQPVAARKSLSARSARFSPCTPGQIVALSRLFQRDRVGEPGRLDERDERV